MHNSITGFVYSIYRGKTGSSKRGTFKVLDALDPKAKGEVQT